LLEPDRGWQDEATALLARPYLKRNSQTVYESEEKPASERLMENVQMQGFRNPEERGVHKSTPQ